MQPYDPEGPLWLSEREWKERGGNQRDNPEGWAPFDSGRSVKLLCFDGAGPGFDTSEQFEDWCRRHNVIEALFATWWNSGYEDEEAGVLLAIVNGGFEVIGLTYWI